MRKDVSRSLGTGARLDSWFRVSAEGASSDTRDVAIFGVIASVLSVYSNRIAAVGLRPDPAQIWWTDDREGELNLTFRDSAGLPSRVVNFIVVERGRLLMDTEELESELGRWIAEVVLDENGSWQVGCPANKRIDADKPAV